MSGLAGEVKFTSAFAARPVKYLQIRLERLHIRAGHAIGGSL
jgi:hypothetical protein